MPTKPSNKSTSPPPTPTRDPEGVVVRAEQAEQSETASTRDPEGVFLRVETARLKPKKPKKPKNQKNQKESKKGNR